jgi:hypothetical protein
VSVKAKIIGGTGRGIAAGVTSDHALMVEQMPSRLASVDPQLLGAKKLYREWFSQAGLTTALNVTGTFSAPYKFTIDSKTDRLVSISSMRVIFESTLMAMNTAEIRRFGPASTADLPNGLRLYAYQGGVQTAIFLDPVRTIADFLYYSSSYQNVVDGIANGVDLATFFITFETPIHLPAGSTDRLELQVMDALTGIARFQIMVLGTQEIKINRG